MAKSSLLTASVRRNFLRALKQVHDAFETDTSKGHLHDGTKAAKDIFHTEEVLFTETAGAGTYTGSVSLPANATIVDIIIHAVALWTAATSATMKVGDVADDDGIFTGINLKATDLLAAEGISFAHTGGKEGADVDSPAAGAHIRRRFLATARVVSGIVTTVGATGATGITRMTVIYSVPTSTTAATKA